MLQCSCGLIVEGVKKVTRWIDVNWASSVSNWPNSWPMDENNRPREKKNIQVIGRYISEVKLVRKYVHT